MQILEKKQIIIGIITFLAFLIIILSYLCFNFYNKDCICKTNELTIDYKETNNDEKIFVDIKGAINNPGVYESNNGEIIKDIIDKAGGLTKDAYTDNINLSKKVEDELVIYIFTKDEIKKNNNNNIQPTCKTESYIINTCTEGSISIISSNDSSTDSNAKTDLININTADLSQLMEIPGVGEVKASSIITYRTENGLFKNIEEIKNVSGIGDATFEKLKDYITV